MRDWLLSMMPDIDGPTLHALTEEFKNEGVVTYSSLLECVDGGAIEIDDLKQYMRNAKLPKVRQVIVLRAFRNILGQ